MQHERRMSGRTGQIPAIKVLGTGGLRLRDSWQTSRNPSETRAICPCTRHEEQDFAVVT